MKSFSVIYTLLLLLGLSSAATATPTELAGGSIPAPQDDRAIYQVTFASTWSEETHPGFPAGAHFSPLIGATHSLSANFWMSGTLASPGIEQMAETGGTSILRDEINAADDAVLETISGASLGASPAEVIIPQIAVDQEHSLVTLVTMIAPSPDWFVGVHDLSLQDGEGNWQDSVVVTLYPYDAGSDDGTDYTSPDAEADPHQPIRSMQGESPFSSEPIGTLTFTRLRMNYLPLILR